MPYQNEGHIFAVISKRRSYIISKWKSQWKHSPPFFCLFAFQTAVCNENGEFYVDKVIEIIIAVVVGGLLLTSVYAIFQNTVLPGLAAKIQAIFS